MNEHTGVVVKMPTDSNRGELIDAANSYVGVPLGSAWCAAIISLAYKMRGALQPRDARAAALFPQDKLIDVRFATRAIRN